MTAEVQTKKKYPLTTAKQRDAEAAHNMKMAGATDEEIARVVGYTSPHQARMAWQKHMSHAMKEDPDAQKYGRTLAGQRLERLLRTCWHKAINPDHPEHLRAVAQAQSVIADYCKLYGLTAPAELTIHTPTKQALEAWVDKVTGAGMDDIEEPNIFDVEVIETPEIEG